MGQLCIVVHEHHSLASASLSLTLHEQRKCVEAIDDSRIQKRTEKTALVQTDRAHIRIHLMQ